MCVNQCTTNSGETIKFGEKRRNYLLQIEKKPTSDNVGLFEWSFIK